MSVAGFELRVKGVPLSNSQPSTLNPQLSTLNPAYAISWRGSTTFLTVSALDMM